MATKTPLTASEVASKLNLKPHPEGGFFSETFRDTSITLTTSQLPPPHCEPLTILELDEKDGSVKLTCIGQDITENQLLQYTTPPNVWFGAFPTNDYDISADYKVVKKAPRDAETHFSLVGCTVAPAFQFEDFVLAKRSDLLSRFPAHESLVSLITFED